MTRSTLALSAVLTAGMLGACATDPAVDIASADQLQYYAERAGGAPSPAIRALKPNLTGIAPTTSCELPLHMRVSAGTLSDIAGLGEVSGQCEGTDVVKLDIDGVRLHMRTIAPEESLEGLTCQDIYRYNPPTGPAQYNVLGPGSSSFKVGDFCRNQPFSAALAERLNPAGTVVWEGRGSGYISPMRPGM